MNKIKDTIFRSPAFVSLKEQAGSLEPGKSIALRGVAGSLLAFVAASVYERRPVLLITAGEDQAEKLRDDCALLAGEQNVRYLGAAPSTEVQSLDMTAAVAQ